MKKFEEKLKTSDIKMLQKDSENPLEMDLKQFAEHNTLSLQGRCVTTIHDKQKWKPHNT